MSEGPYDDPRAFAVLWRCTLVVGLAVELFVLGLIVWMAA